MARNDDVNALALVEQGSYIAPPKEEFDRSNLSALFQGFNSTAIAIRRGETLKQKVDPSVYGPLEFTNKNVASKLKELGYSDQIISNTLRTYNPNWETAINRAAFFKENEAIDRQINQNFSVGERVAAGIGIGVFTDPVDMAIGVPFSMAYKGAKAANNTEKIFNGLGVGLGAGVASEGAYQAVRGEPIDENSLLFSGLLGMGLVGTLSAFQRVARENPSLTKYVDEDGKPMSELDAKATTYTNVDEAKTQLDGLINEVKAKINERSEAKAKVDAERKKAIKNTRVDKRLSKTSAEEARDYAKKIADEAKALAKKGMDSLNAARKNVGDLGRSIVKNEQATTQYTLDKTELDALVRERSPLKGQLTKTTKAVEDLKTQVAELEKKVKQARSPATRKAANTARIEASKKLRDATKKYNEAKRKFNKADKKVILTEKKVAKYDPETPTNIKTSLKALEQGKKDVEKLTKYQVDLDKKAVEAAEAHKVAKDTVKNSKLKVNKEEVFDTPETRALMARLDELDVELSPAGLQKLVEARNIVDEDLAKIAKDDFNLSSLYKVRKQKENYLTKLEREVNELLNVENLQKTPAFKRLPEMARKLLITPSSQNLNSSTNAIANFTSLLTSGTLHQGRINNHTAENIKELLDTKLDRFHKSLLYNYKEALADGSFKGKISEFEAAVGEASYRAVGQFKRELYTAMDGTIIGKERMKKAMERAGSIKRADQTDNKWINNAVNDHLDYYEAIFKRGSDVDLAAFRNVLGKGYVRRMYDPDKITNFKYVTNKGDQLQGREAAIAYLVDAQRSWALSTGSRLDDDVMLEFAEKAATAIDGSLDRMYRFKQITDPLGYPTNSTENALKTRSIDVFEDDIVDILDTDVRNITHSYSMHTHGRIALKEKLGADTDDQVEGLIKQLGGTDNEIDNMRVIVETIRGTRELPNHPFNPVTRGLKLLGSFSSMMHTMGFVVPTLTEVTALTKEYGAGKTIKHLIGTPAEIVRIYRYGTPSEQNTMRLFVSYADSLSTHRAIRWDETNLGSVDAVTQWLDNIVQKEAIYGGLLPVTDMLRMASTTLAVDFMAGLSVAGKISKTDLMRLQDMGFDESILPRIRKTLDVQPDGTINNIDRSTWGALDEEITFAVQTAVKRTILHPDGISLPKFMTDMDAGQILPRLVFKFMRFPIASYERLLGRGIQEMDAKQIISFATNIGMWAAILSFKDAMKDPIDQKYNTADGELELIKDSFVMGSVTSGPMLALDTFYGAFTGKNASNDYRWSPGSAIWSDIRSAQQGTFKFSTPAGSVPVGTVVGEAVGDNLSSILGFELLNDKEEE